jgi:hypothetical protein
MREVWFTILCMWKLTYQDLITTKQQYKGWKFSLPDSEISEVKGTLSPSFLCHLEAWSYPVAAGFLPKSFPFFLLKDLNCVSVWNHLCFRKDWAHSQSQKAKFDWLKTMIIISFAFLLIGLETDLWCNLAF